MKPKHFLTCDRAWLGVGLLLVSGALQVGPAAAKAKTESAPGGRAQLRSIAVSENGESTDLVVELTRATSWKLFTLDHPRRAVLDLQHTSSAGRFRTPPATAMVSNVRSGPQANGSLRLVLDLAEPSRVSGRLLAADGQIGPRLQITVQGAAKRKDVSSNFASASVNPSASPVVSSGVSAGVTSVSAGVTGASAGVTQDVSPRPSPTHSPNASSQAATPRSAAVRAPHAPGNSGRPIIIAVDAGHGGPDPGASGHGGTHEKDVVLGIARALAARINREPGMQAVLTRDGDYFLTLRQRIGKARSAKADMFVSVHADAVRNPGVSGASVYVLSEKGATNEQARWLAERENAADLKGGVSLDDKSAQLATVLLDLSQTASLSASLQAAERVLSSLDGVGQVRKPQVQQAGFVVLKSPDIPSMLVETAYISNPQDERKLRQPEHQLLLAQAIFNGVHAYFERNPPDGTQFARGDSAGGDSAGGGSALARGAL